MTSTPRLSVCGRGFFFSIAVFALSCATTAAQCSQAPSPAATPALPASAARDNLPPASASDSSSSAGPVRFATGTAVTVLEDTPLQVMNDMPISSRTTKAGAELRFTVTQDVVVNGILVIPCGATVYGTVVEAKQAGRLVGTSNITLKLTALNLDGKSYPLYTPPFKIVGQSKTRPTVAKVAGGAAAGAITMDALLATSNPSNLTRQPGPRAFSDGTTAALGAGVGTAIAAATPPSIAMIPAESELVFTLASPIAVYPVDQKTAERLAQGVHPGGPVLYIRGENQ